MSRGAFVTGTDTGVGKTLAACALIHALRLRGLRAVPMKPFAAGANLGSDGRLVNDDTLRLLAAAGLDTSWAQVVTPVVLRDPMAPHIAAAREGRTLSLEPIVQALQRLYAAGDFVVVEGVGGFKVPLGDRLDTVDLARELAFPVVLVVGLRLGCLNHALISADAIRAAGLRLAGWIGSAVDPGMAARDENIDALRARLGAPLLGILAHSSAPDARELASSLDCAPLLA